MTGMNNNNRLINAGDVVKKAARQVEQQAELLRDQLNQSNNNRKVSYNK